VFLEDFAARLPHLPQLTVCEQRLFKPHDSQSASKEAFYQANKPLAQQNNAQAATK
jgi:hypothetical protein